MWERLCSCYEQRVIERLQPGALTLLPMTSPQHVVEKRSAMRFYGEAWVSRRPQPKGGLDEKKLANGNGATAQTSFRRAS